MIFIHLDSWPRETEGFNDNFNKFHPNFRFIHEYSRKHVTFLDLDVKILDDTLIIRSIVYSL